MTCSKPRAKAGRTALIATFSAISVSSAGHSQTASDPALVCKQNNVEVFTSDETDIAAFDAAQYGVSLVQITPIPGANLNLYIFNPGEIICAIKADEDTSSVAP